MEIFVGLLIVLTIILLIVVIYTNEHLSLSQFPIPNCSTGTATYYTCGQGNLIFQAQNLTDRPACATEIYPAFRTVEKPSCFQGPAIPFTGNNLQSCAEPFHVNQPEPQVVCDGGSCALGCSEAIYGCKQAAGTYDGGSTWERGLPCPLEIPPIMPGLQVFAHKQSLRVSEADIKDHLDAGGVVMAANTGAIIDFTMKSIIKQNTTRAGYPDFYYIVGPIVVMMKANGRYYWMIDYPIKYTPANIKNYVNSDRNWNVAKTFFHMGRRLLNPTAPFIFFSKTGRNVIASPAACQPAGVQQSNTDSYNSLYQ
jgi:hypothetical protein